MCAKLRENRPGGEKLRQPDYFRPSWQKLGNRFWGGSQLTTFQSVPLTIVLCGYSIWRSPQSFERRNSSVFSLELVVNGDAIFVQDGKRYQVGPGEVFLIHQNRNSRFSVGPSGFLHKRMVLIQGVMLDLVLQSLDLLDTHVVCCRNFSSLRMLFKRATRVSAEGKITDPDDAAWELSSLAYEILLSVARNRVEEKVPPRIRRSMTFMLHNLDKPLTLEQIAAKSGMSIFHFSRRFREAAGSPPITYFMHQKMRLAQNLLKNSNMLVKEIATILGYDDPLYFSAQFKKFCGISPREYRAKQP